MGVMIANCIPKNRILMIFWKAHYIYMYLAKIHIQMEVIMTFTTILWAEIFSQNCMGYMCMSFQNTIKGASY